MRQSKSEFWSGEEYDSQYGHLYANNISLLNDLARQKDATSLLDVCCGTGLVTIPLSNDLKRTVGIDFSLPMLRYANEKSKDLNDVEFYEADATNFCIGETFDLISMTGNAFQAFITESSLKAVLGNIRQHMHSNSLFVFDTRLLCQSNLEAMSICEYRDSYIGPNGEQVQVEGKGSKHQQFENTILLDIRREYQSGERYDSQIELKYWSLDEVRQHLASCNLEVVEMYADWNKTPIEDSSTNLVAVVQPL
ncbi:conserved hypothetical protein [Vibrio nigripulchritudo MADA3029]|uniref:class I SAM-dependent DNA methyltransferase n=1 Tax=Vibrio nigripulchritudo TaxID=28173 RepID=UPI0003B1C33A|nr:class I SAM-dependent methyltransferase [Vibrio nigripulchritudo]CCN49416.1 conserved hypothetical protein [Vibrio nigripulchritudo MADA3020]CCN53786.1 conserved hypothetical protein [Vibrio nigripulchritudo MADA3021]CCN58918.1 conserved hypothetical protein [Vibrio nigripulchritudo MADA3029]